MAHNRRPPVSISRRPLVSNSRRPPGSSGSRGRLVLFLALVAVSLLVVDRAGDRAPTHSIRAAVRDAFATAGDDLAKAWPFSSANSVIGRATRDELQRQNTQLRQQLLQAQASLAANAEANREYRSLLAIAALPVPGDTPKVMARVTALDTSDFATVIEIDKGSDAGIQADMPVINGAGLVGRVLRTSHLRSTVELLTDLDSNIGVRVGTSSSNSTNGDSPGEVGVVAGQGRAQPLRIDLIDLDSTVKAGDVAVTSGLQHSLFPPGIPVGTVRSSTAGPGDLRRRVLLDPAVNIGTVDDVAVLQWKPS